MKTLDNLSAYYDIPIEFDPTTNRKFVPINTASGLFYVIENHCCERGTYLLTTDKESGYIKAYASEGLVAGVIREIKKSGGLMSRVKDESKQPSKSINQMFGSLPAETFAN